MQQVMLKVVRAYADAGASGVARVHLQHAVRQAHITT